VLPRTAARTRPAIRESSGFGVAVGDVDGVGLALGVGELEGEGLGGGVVAAMPAGTPIMPALTKAEAITASLGEATAHLPYVVMNRDQGDRDVGVGPHLRPWPADDRLDPELLEHGDRRNVVDRYRYWSNDAIVADLETSRRDFHVAIENWQHDFNIGAVVRNANAFQAAAVHIVGNRRWNRRGAMVTDRYVDVRHHSTVSALASWATSEGLPLIGVDLLPGSQSIVTADLPRRCVLVFGQEGPGLSDVARAACTVVLHIPQHGSTRSINAGVASGIAMYEWLRRHDPA
jgi:tRNA(Leu) C34 or U34 (ribose-2'-O)-methylase TrmL